MAIFWVWLRIPPVGAGHLHPQNALDPNLAIVPSFSSILAAFGISAAIGVLFGYLPAKKQGKPDRRAEIRMKAGCFHFEHPLL